MLAPAVKPTITEWEMYRVRSPRCSRLMLIWIAPTRKAIRMAARILSSWGKAPMALSRAIEIALVGPLMSCRDESNSAPIAVMTIAV
jgi:hypothetical protein